VEKRRLRVQPDSGRRHRDFCARAIVVATGVQYRRLPIDRLEEFEGAGLSYAATELEARQVQGRSAVVIGGGNSAGQAAMFLSRRAARVHLVVRGASLAASMSDYLIERIRKNDAITLHFHAQVTALHGGRYARGRDAARPGR
jgi:thioredoxin reductase (NADPH)